MHMTSCMSVACKGLRVSFELFHVLKRSDCLDLTTCKPREREQPCTWLHELAMPLQATSLDLSTCKPREREQPCTWLYELDIDGVRVSLEFSCAVTFCCGEAMPSYSLLQATATSLDSSMASSRDP